jgi:hypothetical protein
VTDYISGVQDAVERMHGRPATHFSTVSLKEVFGEKTVWEGDVEIFILSSHPCGTVGCYAWAYQDNNGKTHYTAILRRTPISSPQDAVKASIMARVKNQNRKTEGWAT